VLKDDAAVLVVVVEVGVVMDARRGTSDVKSRAHISGSTTMFASILLGHT